MVFWQFYMYVIVRQFLQVVLLTNVQFLDEFLNIFAHSLPKEVFLD